MSHSLSLLFRHKFSNFFFTYIGIKSPYFDSRYQCDQVCAKFRHFGKIFKKTWANFWGFINYFAIFLQLWKIFYAIGQMFVHINGQILKNNLPIWSHYQIPHTTYSNTITLNYCSNICPPNKVSIVM